MTALLLRRPTGRARLLSPTAALGLFVGGWVHLCLYRHGYKYIPTIGTLFAVNVGVSAAVGLALLFRRELVVRVAGVGVAVGTLAAFVASRLPGGIFHFQERGWQPHPQAAMAVIAETVAIVLLVSTFAWDRRPQPVPAETRA